MNFWKFIKNAAAGEIPESAELRIEGDIVDDDFAWLYEWYGEKYTAPNAFRESLNALGGVPLTVWIDSYGGSVFAAAGIYNALMEYKGPVTVKIDGKAMSAATIIAMAGEKILMSPVAIMMIHNPLTYAEGYASDLRKTADVLDEVKETIVNAYQLKTGKSRNKISALMDEEFYMSARTAIKEGFADEMMYAEAGEPSEPVNLAFRRQAVYNCTNDAIKRMIELQKTAPAPAQKPDTAVLKAKMALQLEL